MKKFNKVALLGSFTVFLSVIIYLGVVKRSELSSNVEIPVKSTNLNEVKVGSTKALKSPEHGTDAHAKYRIYQPGEEPNLQNEIGVVREDEAVIVKANPAPIRRVVVHPELGKVVEISYADGEKLYEPADPVFYIN
jgi:hypothetical protein